VILYFLQSSQNWEEENLLFRTTVAPKYKTKKSKAKQNESTHTYTFISKDIQLHLSQNTGILYCFYLINDEVSGLPTQIIKAKNKNFIPLSIAPPNPTPKPAL